MVMRFKTILNVRNIQVVYELLLRYGKYYTIYNVGNRKKNETRSINITFMFTFNAVLNDLSFCENVLIASQPGNILQF